MIDGFNIKVLVTTLTSQGSGPWGCDSSDITGAVSTTDGLSNTNSMMTANCNIQKICRNMGATWYLPAQNELDTIYSNKPALGLVTTNLNQYGDGAWSSTQLNSGSAYYHSQWAYGWVYTYKTLNYGAFLYE